MALVIVRNNWALSCDLQVQRQDGVVFEYAINLYDIMLDFLTTHLGKGPPASSLSSMAALNLSNQERRVSKKGCY